MYIQNISLRPNHRDVIYGTGDWNPCEIKDVPDDVGKKMREHTDVYIELDAAFVLEGTVQRIVPAAPFEEDEMRDFYDSLILMSKDQMKTFIENRFNMRVDMRHFPTDDALRAHTRMLVERYGVS